VLGEAFAVRADAPTYILRAPGAYLCPKADGRIVIGATEAPHARLRAPDPAAIERLRAAAARAVPAIADALEIERWAGLRPATPDGAPILGRDPRGPANLWLALGHYRNGVLLAPETAARLAPAILAARDPQGLSPFRPDRFPVQSLEVVDREDR
jgi:glycine oxidase